jgi:hypothetical protein
MFSKKENAYSEAIFMGIKFYELIIDMPKDRAEQFVCQTFKPE